MKKIVLILFVALCCIDAAFGQTEKEKVAIYTTDNSGENIAEFVGDFLTNAIVKKGQYIAIERTSQFLAELDKEQAFQRTGAVDDAQISELGKNMGVQFVCVVKIGRSGDQLFISARLVNVETAALQATSRPIRFDANDWDGIEKSCEDTAASLFVEYNKGQLVPAHARIVFDNNGRATSASDNSSTANTRRHPAEPEMVMVEGGTFLMGCTSEQGNCNDDESPNHYVNVSDFYMAKYEVTQAQWQAVMGTSVRQQRDKAGSSYLYGEGANYPMYYVSWHEAQEFISRLNELTGKTYRLPTEAEWEYAARGGKHAQTNGYKYSGSNFIELVAWFSDNSGSTTHPVGSKSPNQLGIYDMSGNVWEWCYDWKGTYSGGSQTNPTGPDSGSYRVVRGGGWSNSAGGCRVAIRGNLSPSLRDGNLGFRLVLSL